MAAIGDELAGGDEACIGLGYQLARNQRVGVLERSGRGENGHQSRRSWRSSWDERIGDI